VLGKESQSGQMFQYIQLADLVPEDHLLRQIRRALKLEVIYEATKGCYSPNKGRPSVDPTVAFRMILLGYLYNLSEKRMCEEVAMHAGFRWFCDLDFNSSVPDRTTLVKLRRHTWGEKVFRQVMEAIVGQCIEAGLVKGRAAVVDGSQVRARAAVTSLEAIEPVQSIEEYCNRLAQEDPPQAAAEQKPPDNDSANGGSGTARKAGDPDFHGERFSNRTHRSKTDPDARLFSKGDRVGAQLSYLVHDLMDLKSGVILDTTASRAYGALEREAPPALVDNVAKVHGDRLALRYLPTNANDTSAALLADVLARGLEPVVPTKTLSKAAIPGPLHKACDPG
jgi:Transposase and inactivated derivatives